MPPGEWVIHLDGGLSFVSSVSPDLWQLEVKQGLNRGQLERVVYDAERAMLRAFGCHYVPAFEEQPETKRPGSHPKALNRAELDGLQLTIRSALLLALGPHTSEF